MNSDKSDDNKFESASFTAGQLNAIVKKLGGREGARRFLRGDLLVSEPPREWHEENGIIRFKVTSDGTTGEGWVARLENKGFRVNDYAKQVLRSPDFKPSSGIATEIVVLKGSLFKDDDRITKNIRAEADKRKLAKPNAEVACLIREKFTDKEIEAMGLMWIVVMHEPIKDYDDYPSLLDMDRCDCRLSRCSDGSGGSSWDTGSGFAFVAAASLV